MPAPSRRGLHHRLIAALAAVVPRALRAEWRQEWDGELDHYEKQLRDWRTPRGGPRHGRSAGWPLLARSAGAVCDVLWLQRRRLEDEMVQDVRFGLRLLRRAPAFASAAILSLAIGIGATTAVFTLINAALLKPLPYPDVDRLVAVRTADSRFFSVPGFLGLAGSGSLERLSAFETVTLVLGDGRPEQLQGQLVTREFGGLVGLDGPLKPAAGRPFAPNEFDVGHDQVALISHRLWTRRYGGGPDVVGRVVSIDVTPTTIVGVLPPEFDLFATGDVLMPLVTGGPREQDRFYRSLEVLGRLGSGVGTEQAAAQTAAAMRTAPGEARPTLRLELVRELLVRDFTRTLYTMWAVTGLVLLIGCANFANLLSARTVARAHEIAVRSAIGAGRGRVVRQLVVEGVVLAYIGGGLGVLLAIVGRQLLTTAMTPHFLGAGAVGLDWRVLTFASAIAIAAGAICGVVPALRADAPARPGVGGTGRGWFGGLARAPRHGVSTGLAVAQIGLTLVLLVGAGLLVKSMVQLDRFEPGYSTAATTVGVELPATTYPDDAAVARFVAGVSAALQAAPGVTTVGATSSLPLAETAFRFRSFTVENGPTGPVGPPERLPLGFLAPPPPPGPPPGIVGPRFFQTFSAEVGPGFFAAMGIPLVAGRDVASSDTSTAEPIALVNQAFADRYWPGQSAVGKRLRMTPVAPWITVVGVVGNIRRFSRDDEIRSELYRPFTQQGDRRRGDRRPGQRDVRAFVTGVAFVVRTERPPDDVKRTALAALASIDPALPIGTVSTLQGDLDRAVAPRRFLLRLFTAFAGAGLVLAALGVYGVTAYVTRRRTRELAVRVALGASPGTVEALVLRQGWIIASLGVSLGLALSLGMSRFLQQYLYEVQPIDAWIYGGVATTLVVVVLLASYLPARHASHLDPLATLKQE